MRALKILLLLASSVVSFGIAGYVIKKDISLSTEIKELTKRELQLSIEVKELQKRKLNCEFKTKRCPNG